MRRGAFRAAIVVVVLGLGIVAGVGTAATGTTDATASNGSDATSVPADESDGAVGTTPAQTTTLGVIQEYRLTPDEPGQIDIQWQFSVPDNVEKLSDLQPPAGAKNVRHDGFRETSSGYVWEESEQPTRNPTLTYTVEVNRTDDVSGPIGTDGRYLFVDEGDWALIRRQPGPGFSYTRTTERKPRIEQTNTTAGPGVVGQSLVFLGPHETYERQAHDQRFRLVVPDAATLEPGRERVFRTVTDASGTLRVGDRDRQVLMFVAPASVPWAVRGLQTGDRDFYSVADEPVDDAENVWVHEYVHTRQEYEAADATRWTTEAFAEYYAALLTLEQGRIGFDEFRANLDRGTWRRFDDVVLADRSTWAGTGADYYVGALVAGEIDRRMRLATDRARSLQAVLRRMNDQSGPVAQADLLEYVGTVAGSDPQRAARRYTETTTRPNPWTESEHGAAFDPLPAEFVYSFPSPDSGDLRVTGPYRNRTLSDAVLVPGETLVVVVNVTNVGGSEGEYDLTVTRNGEAIATRTGTAVGGETVTERVRVTFEDTGAYTLSTGGEGYTVAVTDPATPTVTDLAVNRTTVTGSGPVRVTATVTAGTDRPAAGTVAIRRGGDELTAERVRLDAGGTTTVSATATLTAPGEYRFGAGDRTVTVSVADATTDERADDTAAGESGAGLGVRAAVLALASLLLAYRLQ